MNTPHPTYEEIVALHKKYAPSDAAFNLVFTHCQVVWELAEQRINAGTLPIDAQFVKVGCLLYDIGAYHFCSKSGVLDLKDYIKHGIIGYDILKQEGFAEQLCRVASHHTGVGLSAQEIQSKGLPLPVEDYFAESIEERLIMYADKFHTKSTPPKLLTPAAYCEFVSTKFGADKVARFKKLEEEFGAPDLALLAQKYGLEIA
jgi:uncharacterized protein